MLSVEEAKETLMKHVPLLKPKSIELSRALGSVLTEDIFSPIDYPPFSQSAMDGYAICLSGKYQDKFFVRSEIKAGDSLKINLREKEAARIFTGAKIPENTECVIIQEKSIIENDMVSFSDFPEKGENIRKKGEHIRKGELALHKNTVFSPAAIGFLSSLGIRKVKVYSKPKIAIVITGNELIKTGKKLSAGKIYESNSFSLSAALLQMHLSASDILLLKDDKKTLLKKIRQAVSFSDVVMVSGGISIGKYDFSNEVFNSIKVIPLFYKVAQKPGKPFYAGTKNNKLIFGLPGNPAATLSCFYEYIYPALKKMQGYRDCFLEKKNLKLLRRIDKKDSRSHFIRALSIGSGVMPLDKQDSSDMRTFAHANSLIYFPKNKNGIEAGEEVEVHLLPR